MHYAINLADLFGHKDSLPLMLMIRPVVPQHRAVQAEPDRSDGLAVPLECEEGRAKAIVELIQRKYKKPALRCYQSSTGNGGWKRI